MGVFQLTSGPLQHDQLFAAASARLLCLPQHERHYIAIWALLPTHCPLLLPTVVLLWLPLQNNRTSLPRIC
jgi:hypothetical protein